MTKVLFYVYEDADMCLQHVFLYLKELNRQKIEARMILEGKAAGLLATLAGRPRSLEKHLFEARDKGWILGVCKACATVMKAVEATQKEFIPLLDEMDGHAPLARFVAEGWTIIKF